MNLPEPDSLVKPHEYEKFHALFERAFPRPKRKAQVAQWKFKREIAWRGWMFARETPYEAPKNTLTSCHIQGLSPSELETIWRRGK
jgi:hypothetical protein